MDVSLVIPVYHSETTVSEVVTRCAAVLDAMGVTREFVLVNDGSRDRSWETLCRLHAEVPGVTVIDLMRNYGQHNALMCGLRAATGRYVVTMDDDLQQPPEALRDLYAAIDGAGHDLVYGVPRHRRHAGWRNAGSALIRLIFRLALRVDYEFSPLRIIRRDLVDSILNYASNFTFLDGLLAWNTQRVGHVEVAHHPRARGRSGYRLRSLLDLALNVLTNFSTMPLRLATVAGFGMAAAGTLTAVIFLLRSLAHRISVPGYASTIIAILILGGVQLICLGVVGEYVGRIHMHLNEKPQYAVRTRLPAGAAKGAAKGAA